MPEFLVQRVLVLHSPSVLYAALSKLTSGLSIWRMPEFLVQRVLVLHSPSVLYAALSKLTRGLSIW